MGRVNCVVHAVELFSFPKSLQLPKLAMFQGQGPKIRNWLFASFAHPKGTVLDTRVVGWKHLPSCRESAWHHDRPKVTLESWCLYIAGTSA